jgi:hypothetical protein
LSTVGFPERRPHVDGDQWVSRSSPIGQQQNDAALEGRATERGQSPSLTRRTRAFVMWTSSPVSAAKATVCLTIVPLAA